jgi:hypothetical protein
MKRNAFSITLGLLLAFQTTAAWAIGYPSIRPVSLSGEGCRNLSGPEASVQNLAELGGYLPGGVTLASTVTGSPAAIREFAPVISGVLYRGGGAGGQVPLTPSALQSLCQKGFSKAVYLYSMNWTYGAGKSVECTTESGKSNILTYVSKVWTQQQGEIMEMVANAVKTGSGPVFVHCWNGRHATGAIAAMALREYCGWSGPQAVDYWKRTAKGYDPGMSGIFGNSGQIMRYSPHSGIKMPGCISN